MRATALVLCVVGCGASAVTSVPAHEPEVSAPTPVDDRSRGRLALGDGFGCALLDGGPRCWGTPPLGAGVDLAHPAPLVDAIELSASMERLCARFPGGAVG